LGKKNLTYCQNVLNNKIKCIFSQINWFLFSYNILICENLGYIYNDMYFFSFGQSMKKIIMIKEKKNLERPLLKCIKLQVSNVFSVKLNSLKMWKLWKNLLKWSWKFFIWTKYEKDNNGQKKKKSSRHHSWNVLNCKI